MLQPVKNISKWRPASLEIGTVLFPSKQLSRGLTVIAQSHQGTVFCCVHRSAIIKQILKNNSSHIKLGSLYMIQHQNYSSQKKRSFFSQFIENFKLEVEKNKAMKENLEKFREEREKLEQSEALQKARAKYNTLESEASAKFKDKFDKVKDTFSGVLEEAGKSTIAKKAGKISEELGKSISAKKQKLGATETFKTISEEFEQTTSQERVYVAPKKLRKRHELSESTRRVYEPDTTTTDIAVHKDSRFYESWQNFKNNNPYFHKLMDLKMKYDESDNPVIRASRFVTDKLSYAVEGIFEATEFSEALTQILKVDPTFTKTKFLQQCETDIIPNILEAMARGELEILKDWCHEAIYSQLSVPIKQVKAAGNIIDSKILDIHNLDLAGGQMVDDQPVLVISFVSQQIFCVKDRTGKVVEGDPDNVMRVNYVWALSRDKTELDPKAAWRLVSVSADFVKQLL